ncbi:MAG: CobW family GTP-binding protein [Tumebacillaceae bacterium]
MSARVPIYILTGFLGAGKTTLLQTLLRHEKAAGRRPAVLMNEFGKASVDTLLLEHTAVPVVDLIEGCVCCTVKGSLTEAMVQLLDTYQPDVVFLEATGVAIPLEIVDALLDQPLHSVVKIAGVFALVDTTQFPVHLPPLHEQTAMQQTMVEQVRHADALLLSKTDIARPDRRFAVESFLRGINRQAHLMKVVKGAVDANALLSVRTRHEVKRAGKPRLLAPRQVGRVVPKLRAVERKTSFGQLQTLHYEFQAPVDADRFYEFLYRLPNTVLRGKGFYRDAESGLVHEFHFVPHTPMSAPLEGSLEGKAPAKMFAILIGEQLDEVALRRQLKACETRQ